MGKKSQIEILARVIALAISEGDTEKADEIMAWASAGQIDAPKKEPKDRTQAFIRKHLSPYAPYDKEKVERFINQNIVKPTKNVDFQVVKKKVGNMPYSEFLNTTYWRGVSLFIKRRDGWKCSSCGSSEKVEVHHKTYEHHGDEIHHLEDLTTLCEKCHRSAHKQEKPETEEKEFAPMRTRTRRPKTGSALSLTDMMNGKEIEDGWSALVEKYSCRPRLSNALAKSPVTIHEPENGKQIVAFALTTEAQVRWVEEKFLRDMERDLKEIVGRDDIELRVMTRAS